MASIGTKIGLLALPCLILLMHQPAQAWTTECRENRCGISIAVKDEPSDRRLLSLAVLVNKDGSDPAVVLTTPLGTALEPGARLLIGPQEMKLTFKACFPDGCQAYRELSEDEHSVLRSASTVDALFFAQGSDKPFSAKIELTGLDAALADISD